MDTYTNAQRHRVMHTQTESQAHTQAKRGEHHGTTLPCPSSGRPDTHRWWKHLLCWLQCPARLALPSRRVPVWGDHGGAGLSPQGRLTHPCQLMRPSSPGQLPDGQWLTARACSAGTLRNPSGSGKGAAEDAAPAAGC